MAVKMYLYTYARLCIYAVYICMHDPIFVLMHEHTHLSTFELVDIENSARICLWLYSIHVHIFVYSCVVC